MAKNNRKVNKHSRARSMTNIAQKHVTQRIGAHQRAAQRRKEAKKKISPKSRP